MSDFEYRDRRLFCEDVSITEIAEQAGTPLAPAQIVPEADLFDFERETAGEIAEEIAVSSQ